MSRSTIEIRTDDGVCPAQVFAPAAGGAPGVLLYMDGLGIRPALFAMGERLAGAGYYVLLPDLFYRAGPYQPMDAKKVFADPAARDELRQRFLSTTTVDNTMRDTRAFVAHLRAHARGPRFGATGYCMGGRMALCAAGRFPDDFAAVASFHGGNLANDAPDSPHLSASKIRARIYVAGAVEDPSFPDEQKQRLEKALGDAGVAHVIETYPARHGWVPSDTPVHDAAAAERHWSALIDLFGQTL